MDLELGKFAVLSSDNPLSKSREEMLSSVGAIACTSTLQVKQLLTAIAIFKFDGKYRPQRHCALDTRFLAHGTHKALGPATPPPADLAIWVSS